MKVLLLTAGAAMLLSTVGCHSGDAVAMSNNRLAAYKQFQGQQRSMKLLSLKTGTNGSITIKGDVTLEIEGELDPLHALPSNPTVAQTLIKEGAGVVKAGVQFAAGAYVLDKAFGAAKKEPIVVEQPEPIMIEPHVIEIPAGAGGAGMLQ